MDLRQLTIFREVAKQLSFTKAAINLNYVQSNITTQIHTLEDELGQLLFDRLGKQIVLTNAGQQLLAYAERLLSLAEEAHTVVASGTTPQGTLRIGASDTLCIYRLPTLLRAFHLQYPDVHLIFRSSPTLEQHRLIHEGSIDVAFILDDLDNVGGPGDELLLLEEVSLLAAPDHPFVGKEVITPADIDGADLLLTEAGCYYRTFFDRLLSREGVYPRTLMEFHSSEAVKQCVMTGMGVTVMPTVAVAAEIEQGRLCKLPWKGPDLTISTHMVWHKDKWLSPTLKAFLNLARTMLSEIETKNVMSA